MEWVIVVVIVLAAGWVTWKATRWYNTVMNPPTKPRSRTVSQVKPFAGAVTVRAVAERRSGPPPGYVSPYLPSERWDELLVLDADGMPPLRLFPNKFDKNAIAVMSRGDRIGYINKGMAVRMAKRLDAGEDLPAIVMQVTPLKIVAAAPAILSHMRVPEVS